jgi:hypothetical protein
VLFLECEQILDVKIIKKYIKSLQFKTDRK